MDSEFIDHEAKAEIGGVSIPVVAGDTLKEQLGNLSALLKDDVPLNRNRKYNGQQPKRNQCLVEGLTMRDIRDCYIRGLLSSVGFCHPELPKKVDDGTCCSDDVYEISKDCDFDPIAVAQNMECEIEKMMGIYPNLIDSTKGEQ